MNCPACGRKMRHTQEPFMEGGPNFVEWECSNEDCWMAQAPGPYTIPAPEYNCIWYVYDAEELRRLKREGLDEETLGRLREEYNQARRKFPSAWRHYRG